MTVLSKDSMIISSETFGGLSGGIFDSLGNAGTASTVNSGSTSGRKASSTYTIPTTAGNGVIVTDAISSAIGAGPGMIGIFAETNMGSLAVSTNTFSAGSAMPTRTIGGQSVQMASCIPVLVATVALTATTPVITITYTNQDGVGSRTATLTLPTNAAANTAFLISPHLESGDTGIRSVENLSKSAGSAGTLTVFGLWLPAGFNATVTSSFGLFGTSALPWAPIVLQAGDVLARYDFYTGNNGNTHWFFNLVVDI